MLLGIVVSITMAGGPDQLLIKLRERLPAALDRGDVLRATGDAELDALLQREGVLIYEPAVRVPPRGWQEPEAARALGLERWVIVRTPSDRVRLATLRARVASLKAVERCEIGQGGELLDVTPNDPDFASQWSLQNGKLNAPMAWELVRSVTRPLAVLDTGVDMHHDDLVPNLWQNPGEIAGNGLDDDANGYVDDVHGWDFGNDDNDPDDQVIGHGTHVSGIAAARCDNARQVSGVCWSVPLMALKIFTNEGGLSVADAARAIIYAADNGAPVMNISWKFPDDSSLLHDAIAYAAAADVAIICASGNFGGSHVTYPASYEECIAVIGSNRRDERASFSTFGSWCELSAPGEQILSLYPGNRTEVISGTSMAAPHVAGAAALAREWNRELDREDVRWVLCYSTVDIDFPGFDERTAWGRLDLRHALERSRSLELSRVTAHLGETVTLSLSQPREPGFDYVLLASRAGHVPGMRLSPFFPGEQRHLPLNADPSLFRLILQQGGAGVFQGFIGTLDGAGSASATFTVPRSSDLIGQQIDFCFVTFDPLDASYVASIATTAHLRIQ